jgi:hypothetical protein
MAPYAVVGYRLPPPPGQGVATPATTQCSDQGKAARSSSWSGAMAVASSS